MQSVPADVDQPARRRKTTLVAPTGNRLPHRADTRQCQYRHSNPADHSICVHVQALLGELTHLCCDM